MIPMVAGEPKGRLGLGGFSLRMVVSNRNFLDFQGVFPFPGTFAVTFREGVFFIYFNWHLFLCQESEGEIYFLNFSLSMYPLFAVMSKGTDAYPRARQGSLGHP